MPNWVTVNTEVFPTINDEKSLEEFKRFRKEMFKPNPEYSTKEMFDFNGVREMPEQLNIPEVMSLDSLVFIWFLNEQSPDKKIRDFTEEELESLFMAYLKAGSKDKGVEPQLAWNRFSINFLFNDETTGGDNKKHNFTKTLKNILSRVYLNEVGFLKESDYDHLTVSELKWYLTELSRENPWHHLVYSNKDPLFPMEADLISQYWKNLKETGHITWYSWCCDNWGTKWNACHYEEDDLKDGYIRFQFDTAWSLPTPIMEALVEKYPNLTFDYDFREEQGLFGGSAYSEEGKMVYHFTD